MAVSTGTSGSGVSSTSSGRASVPVASLIARPSSPAADIHRKHASGRHFTSLHWRATGPLSAPLQMCGRRRPQVQQGQPSKIRTCPSPCATCNHPVQIEHELLASESRWASAPSAAWGCSRRWDTPRNRPASAAGRVPAAVAAGRAEAEIGDRDPGSAAAAEGGIGRPATSSSGRCSWTCGGSISIAR